MSHVKAINKWMGVDRNLKYDISVIPYEDWMNNSVSHIDLRQYVDIILSVHILLYEVGNFKLN